MQIVLLISVLRNILNNFNLISLFCDCCDKWGISLYMELWNTKENNRIILLIQCDKQGEIKKYYVYNCDKVYRIQEWNKEKNIKKVSKN